MIAVERDVVSGVPAEISTSYVERSDLTMRMQCRRFGRLANAYSKTLPNHAAAVSLHIAFYNLCRIDEPCGPHQLSRWACVVRWQPVRRRTLCR